MADRRPLPRVLVAYPFLMHYRRAVFQELDRSTELSVVFAASPHGAKGIAAMSPDEVRRFVPTEILRWRGFEWQRGVVRIALFSKLDAAVFLGDWASVSTWVAAAVLRVRRIPVLFWTIGWHRPERGLRRLVRLGFYRLADELLLYGDIGRRLGVAHGYPPRRMRVVSNSIGPSPGALSPRISAVGETLAGQEVVGAVIRLNPAKQLHLLVAAVADLRERTGREVAVLLVGEGPAREALRADAAARGVRLIMPGAAYSDADLAVVYSRLTVTAVPTAAGLTTIQSLTHGVPVVSDDDPYSQAPEWEAIIPGRTGGTYPRGDIRGFADELERWLDRVRDDPAAVAAACTAEVAARWNAERQGALITEAIVGRL